MKRPIALVPVLTGAVLCAALSVPSASGAGRLPRPVDCPTPLPAAQAVKDLRGTGWTVDAGTAPKPFSAKVLGRLAGAIAPGVDMIMARVESPALTEAGGVWAGMSGSPVYAPDGRLIGAVAYSLAPSTMVAGITPAQDMERLLSADPDDSHRSAARPARIRPDAAAVRTLEREGVAPAAAAQGFVRLRVPVTLSGGTSPGAGPLLQRLQRRIGQPVSAGGSAPRGTAAATAMFGGGNFAAVASTGDATLAGVGTTTLTCRGRALAFGHPFTGAGPTTLSANAATAVFVQPDPVSGPNKMANISGSVGTVDRDRLFGLRARLGAAPQGPEVSSRLTRVETGAVRSGRSMSFYRPVNADVAAFHLLANVDLVQNTLQATGTARVTVTITGRRSGGRSITLRHSDLVTAAVAGDPLDFDVAEQLFSTVSALQDQPFEDVTLRQVRVTGTVSSRAALWTQPVVQIRQGGKWVSASRGVVVRPGTTLRTRTRLTRLRAPGLHTTVEVPLTVPKAASRRPVELVVTGGHGDAEQEGPGSQAGSLDDLLAQLRSAPHGDDLSVRLVNSDSGRVYAARTRRASLGVDGFSTSFPAEVR